MRDKTNLHLYRRSGKLSEADAAYAEGVQRYSDDPANIGNQRGPTYLGEMLKVYRECYRVLKPGGLIILVTKDFYRKGTRVPLAEHTIALCEMAGFSFRERHARKLTNLSFWQRLRQKKGHPVIEEEDILVLGK